MARNCAPRGASGQHGRPFTRISGIVGIDAVGQLGLDAQVDRGDRPPVVTEPERVDPVEEAELDPAVAQDLVEGGEDHLAHARLHLPEQRSRVPEEHLGRQLQSEPGTEAWTGRIAVLVAEDEVVHAPEDR